MKLFALLSSNQGQGVVLQIRKVNNELKMQPTLSACSSSGLRRFEGRPLATATALASGRRFGAGVVTSLAPADVDSAPRARVADLVMILRESGSISFLEERLKIKERKHFGHFIKFI